MKRREKDKEKEMIKVILGYMIFLVVGLIIRAIVMLKADHKWRKDKFKHYNKEK